MGFSDAKSGAVAAVFTNLGVSATFTPAVGDPVEGCTVIHRSEDVLTPDGYVGQTYTRIQTIRYQLSDIARNLVTGEKFTIAGVEYVFDGMLEDRNPTLARKAAVK